MATATKRKKPKVIPPAPLPLAPPIPRWSVRLEACCERVMGCERCVGTEYHVYDRQEWVARFKYKQQADAFVAMAEAIGK